MPWLDAMAFVIEAMEARHVKNNKNNRQSTPHWLRKEQAYQRIRAIERRTKRNTGNKSAVKVK